MSQPLMTKPPSELVPASFAALFSAGEQRRFRARTIIIHQQDRGDFLFLLKSGSVRVFVSDANGKEATLATYGPGELLGELSLDGGPRTASVETLQACECVMLSHDTIREQIGVNPQLAFDLLARIILKARAATESATSLALLDAYSRMKNTIEAHAVDLPDGTFGLPQPFTQSVIASRSGCSREMISRLLKDLEQGGYIVRDRRRIRLLKPLPKRW